MYSLPKQIKIKKKKFTLMHQLHEFFMSIFSQKILNMNIKLKKKILHQNEKAFPLPNSEFDNEMLY